MKNCTKCGESKPLTDFYPAKLGRFGRDAYCKKCKNRQTVVWRRGVRRDVPSAINYFLTKMPTATAKSRT